MNKKDLSERDICSKFIGPAVKRAGWDGMMQIREEVNFTKGRIIVRGKLVTRGKAKRADYILYYKPNIPIAIIEAKDNNHSVGDGMQQALDYAATLNIPFVFSSNGDGFVFHDRTGISLEKEANLTLEQFPTPADLWEKYRVWKGLTPDEEQIVLQDYFDDGSGKAPRYYQCNAVNAAIEAIAKGQNRVLLVMATGTGKTYTAFQIIWRLWKAGRKKRILFLADRNVLVDQTMVNDFRPFGAAMAKLSTGAKTIEREDGTEVEITTALDKKRRIDTAYEVYLGLYQAITGPEDRQKLFREFSPGFFDLIVIDECHRGSAAEDSAWREILEYFSGATQIGLTATPKETTYVSNIHYFGTPVYSYSLKQGIQDGFLAPYKVIKVHIDVDVEGYRPERGEVDRYGNEIEDRIYNTRDFDRVLVIDDRTKLVAKKVSDFLKESGDRFQKTILFCVDEEHAARMRQALINENKDLCDKNQRYVMRITGSDAEGQAQLGNFIDPEAKYPVLVTTSRLLSTGVDAQTCRLIVLDRSVGSMTEFKQIVGRGTRVHEDTKKFYFTLIDFRGATNHFADPEFDGDAQRISQLCWMFFLKIIDDQDQELELMQDGYRSPIPEKLRWRAWAADPEGITGDELLAFVNLQLFPQLKELSTAGKQGDRRRVVRDVFEDAYNYMKSGQLMRQVVNKITEVDFNNLAERQNFGDIYEQILNDLQSAGNAGEYYTPRAVTAFMVDRIDPHPGEILLDPACGTGGFLTCALRHMRERYVKKVEDEQKLEQALRAVEKKQLPHMLCVTNMLLHGIENPGFVRHDNTLARPYISYAASDRVDIVLTNPPFGGKEEDGIESNFPKHFQTRETADLFLALIIRILKPGGRAAVVLPDGSLFGEGVKTRLKEHLMEECNLHTIVRLPNSVFRPYASIGTNLLFLEKGEPTKEIWFYEHRVPDGQKAYSMTKPIRIEHLKACAAWWGGRKRKGRVENEVAWRVTVEEVKTRGYNLDFKNPHTIANDHGDPEELLAKLEESEKQTATLRNQLKSILEEALLR